MGPQRRPQRPAENSAGRALMVEAPLGKSPQGSLTRRLRAMSMRSPLERKKSEPRIGFCTSARRKQCFTLRPGKARKMSLFPNVLIEEPFAARRDTEGNEDFRWDADAGKTETSAPLSTNKARLRRRQ